MFRGKLHCIFDFLTHIVIFSCVIRVAKYDIHHIVFLFCSRPFNICPRHLDAFLHGSPWWKCICLFLQNNNVAGAHQTLLCTCLQQNRCSLLTIITTWNIFYYEERCSWLFTVGASRENFFCIRGRNTLFTIGRNYIIHIKPNWLSIFLLCINYIFFATIKSLMAFYTDQEFSLHLWVHPFSFYLIFFCAGSHSVTRATCMFGKRVYDCIAIYCLHCNAICRHVFCNSATIFPSFVHCLHLVKSMCYGWDKLLFNYHSGGNFMCRHRRKWQMVVFIVGFSEWPFPTVCELSVQWVVSG